MGDRLTWIAYTEFPCDTVPKDIQKKSDTLLTKFIFYINNCRLDNNGLSVSPTNMDHFHHGMKKQQQASRNPYFSGLASCY